MMTRLLRSALQISFWLMVVGFLALSSNPATLFRLYAYLGNGGTICLVAFIVAALHIAHRLANPPQPYIEP